MPVVDIDHAIAAVDFHDRRDQRNHVVANRFDVRTVVDDQPVSKFHQSRRRAGFRRVNRSRDVVDGKGLLYQLVSLRVIHVDEPRIGELSQPRTILFHLCQQAFGSDRHGDLFATFFRRAD